MTSTTNMTLSDAIRLGSLLRPQGFGNMYTNGGGSCALGAALEAIDMKDSQFDELVIVLPQVGYKLSCICGFQISPYVLSRIVAHWNDDHHFTREAIADLLEEPGASVAKEQPQAGEAVCATWS